MPSPPMLSCNLNPCPCYKRNIFKFFPPKVTNEQLTLNLYDHFCEFWALVPKERLNESYF